MALLGVDLLWLIYSVWRNKFLLLIITTKLTSFIQTYLESINKLDHNIIILKFNKFVLYVDSSCFTAAPSVPQESILAPLFLNIFINDIVHSLLVYILIYADYFKVYRNINSDSTCPILQNALEKVYFWCLKYKVVLI